MSNRKVKRKTGKSAEDLLAAQLEGLGMDFEREYWFHPQRRWRADFHLPAHDILIEVEGVTPAIGRHQTIGGFQADIEKYLEAAAMGYRVLRLTPRLVRAGAAAETLRRILDRPADEAERRAEARARDRRLREAREKRGK